MKTCPACGFDPEQHDPDAYAAQATRPTQWGGIAVKTVDCNCNAPRWGDRYHSVDCNVSLRGQP